MKRTIFLLFCVLYCVLSFSQSIKLTGKILTNSFTPIEKATILVSLNDSVIAIGGSDGEGSYAIDDLPDAKVGLFVHCLGYETLTDSIDLHEKNNYYAIMKETTISMDSVTVVGHRRPIKTPYGHIYFLSEDAVKSNNPYIALQEIPKLRSDYINEGLSSDDGKSILFLVDGAKMNTGLSPISPSRIESVEVIDVVSSKYIRSGAQRIVNIHLKQTKSLYTYLRLGYGNTFPWKSGWMGPTFEVGNSKLSLYATLTPTWKRYDHASSCKSIRSTDYSRDYNSAINDRNHDLSYQTMIKWRPTKKDYFIVSFQGDDNHSTSDADSKGWHVNANSDSLKYSSYAKSVVRSHVYTSSLYYKHEFGKNLSLENTARYTINNNSQTNNEVQQLGKADIQDDDMFSTKRHFLSQELDLSWEISKVFSLDFGNATDYSTNRIKQESLANQFKFKSLNEYFYTALSLSVGDFSSVLSAGADYMHLNSAGVKNSYLRPNISADISYEKGISETSLEYKLTNSQPAIDKLNPYNTSTDSLIFSSGNPLLVPERTHSLSLMEYIYVSGFSSSTSVDYVYSKDLILPYSYYDKGIYYSTYKNYGSYHGFSVSQTATYSYKTLDFSASAKYGLIKYLGQKCKKYFSLTAYVMWNYKGFHVESDISYQNKSYTPYAETRYRGPYSSAVYVSYNITPDLIFILGSSQTFGKTKYDQHYHVDGYDRISHVVNSNRELRMTVRWTMRKNKKSKINIDENKIKSQEKGISL